MISTRTKVILDTNFLLLPGQKRLDIFEEIQSVMDEPYELLIMDKTIDELESLTKKGKMKDRMSANIALQLLEKQNIRKIDSSGLAGHIVDDFILEVADEDTIIATNDKNLKRELLHRGFRIMETMRESFLRIRSK